MPEADVTSHDGAAKIAVPFDPAAPAAYSTPRRISSASPMRTASASNSRSSRSSRLRSARSALSWLQVREELLEKWLGAHLRAVAQGKENCELGEQRSLVVDNKGQVLLFDRSRR